MRRSAAIARLEVTMISRDVNMVAVVIAVPLLAMAILRPLFEPFARAEGYRAATGAEYAVPGIAVTFAFVLVGFAAMAVYRDHDLNTWERLRASPARPSEVIAGKVLPYVLLLVVQLLLLFGVGAALFDLHVEGSPVALVAVAVALAVCLSAAGMAFFALSRTIQQVLLFTNLGAMLFAGLGGAVAPISTLPSWVQWAAHLLPSYWAVRAFHTVILDGGGTADVAGPIAVLLGFTVVLLAVAVGRFRFDERKDY